MKLELIRPTPMTEEWLRFVVDVTNPPSSQYRLKTIRLDADGISEVINQNVEPRTYTAKTEKEQREGAALFAYDKDTVDMIRDDLLDVQRMVLEFEPRI